MSVITRIRRSLCNSCDSIYIIYLLIITTHDGLLRKIQFITQIICDNPEMRESDVYKSCIETRPQHKTKFRLSNISSLKLINQDPHRVNRYRPNKSPIRVNKTLSRRQHEILRVYRFKCILLTPRMNAESQSRNSSQLITGIRSRTYPAIETWIS